ncbi:uncharacterized protein LOC125178994 [Hyalella azteca]|uniref:Uncharacterized protein LOC125178994 n=1 Tax=Hyalella azteca TaxID=294128 RepID=A0A979FS21_HYAAZ|nr:uncharacterized protein LOC125178994 [Hyalella azteca]
MDAVSDWMRSNRLQLKASKTEFIWFATARRQHQLPANLVRAGDEFVAPASSVRSLGIQLDSEQSMNNHIAKVTAACFGILRRIRSVSRCLSRPVLEALMVALVLTRLDYDNATLYGLPITALNKLQFVMNAAARLNLTYSSECNASLLIEVITGRWAEGLPSPAQGHGGGTEGLGQGLTGVNMGGVIVKKIS